MADDVQLTVDADVSGALASLNSLRQAIDAATVPAARLSRAYQRSFDAIGAGWERAVAGLAEGRLTLQGAAVRATQSVENGLVDLAGTTLSRVAAGPLASLLGLAAPAAGQGVGDVLGGALGHWLTGAPQQLGQAATATANTAALATNTVALGALTAALGAASVAGGAGALGSLGSAASLAGGTAELGAAGSLLAFAQGGIVTSAAGGWALPNFFGARPALLHAREMVLPAAISEGLQQMIGDGGGGSDMHLHFHGPSDGPAVERWFTGLMARNPGVVRNMLRSNALTPRTL